MKWRKTFIDQTQLGFLIKKYLKCQRLKRDFFNLHLTTPQQTLGHY